MGNTEISQPELAVELHRRVLGDQAALRQFPVTAAEAGRMAKVRADNTAWLAKIIDDHGWPGWSMVGDDGAHDAWLLAQHADHDLGFQRRCLVLLRDAVSRSDASATDLAYLEDRVLVAEKQPQIYGTQGRPGEDGLWALCSISDADLVDGRRASVGLEPLAEYIKAIRGVIASGGIGNQEDNKVGDSEE